MRQGNNNNRQRSRGRSGRKPQGQSPNKAIDSNGPAGRLRGTAVQLAEKYSALARDAQSNKDRVVVEGLLQYAEHYQRLVNEATEAQNKIREQNEANRRDNADANSNSTDTQAKGERQPASEQVAAQPTSPQPVPSASLNTTEQPVVEEAAGDGEQPKIDIQGEDKPTPARRQRRTGGQRRTTRSAAKPAKTSGSDGEATTPEAAPEAATKTASEAVVEAAPEAPVAAEPTE